MLNKHGAAAGFSDLNFTNNFRMHLKKKYDFQTRVEVRTHLSEKKKSQQNWNVPKTERHRMETRLMFT